jgi:hypothetical protein
MFIRLGKLVRLFWPKLLIAIALSLLMGFSFGPYVAHEDTAKPEVAILAADVQRGRLLYETHCIACHTTKAHWRDKHIVGSWADLLYQVTRMQKNAGQDWSSTEISDVAAYLNELFYKMPCPSPGCGGPQADAEDLAVLARSRNLRGERDAVASASGVLSRNGASAARDAVAR